MKTQIEDKGLRCDECNCEIVYHQYHYIRERVSLTKTLIVALCEECYNSYSKFSKSYFVKVRSGVFFTE